jgi:agmatinase
VVDPGSAPGTGTPEPGGLSSRQVLDAVRKICYEVPIVGMDIVEVAPGYDHADITVMLANRIVLEAISALSRKAIDAKSGQTWNPSQPLLEGR